MNIEDAIEIEKDIKEQVSSFLCCYSLKELSDERRIEQKFNDFINTTFKDKLKSCYVEIR